MTAKTRDQIADSDKWDLSPMYKSVTDWEHDFNWVNEQLSKIREFQGKLNEADPILEMFGLVDGIGRKLEKVYVWASLKNNEDLSNQEADLCLKKVQKLWNDFGQAVAFIDPELVKLSDEFLAELIKDTRFADYVMQLKGIKRSKPHVLSDKEEMVMAKASILWSDPYSIFGSFDNVDAKFGKIKNENNEEVTVTHGSYATLLESKDRQVRQNAFEAVYKEYKGHIHTLTEVLSAQVKQHNFLTEVRNYDSAAQRALFGKDVDVAVYKNLIKRAHDKMSVFYDYVAKRKELLGVDKLQMWDLRVALLDVDLKFTFDEGIDLVLAASKPLGEEYVAALEKGMRGGWVDRYECKGKRSGGFSSGCYDSMPYILMNFDGTLSDVFTLMHEAGHSMHSYLANKNQPYSLASYPIFTAEIASTVNERLLTNYLLNNWEGDRRQAVLHYEIDAIRATFFRQTMFAEFELLIHEAVAAGQPLTKEFLCEEYQKLNEFYYGPEMAKDEFIKYEWSRIPHFYYNFYVYQYATGIAAAYNFADRILAGDSETYLNLLKSGGCDYPLNLLKEAGLDMTQDFYDPIMDRFGELVGMM